MAFVVARRAGRWEIRESVVTGAGPRARTLATFETLTEEVLGRAEIAATRPFDRRAVVRSARRAGAPIEERGADRLARALLARLAAGDAPSPGLRRLLRHRLESPGPTAEFDAVDDMADWVGATAAARGEALCDLLRLADALPAPDPSTELHYPSWRSVRERASAG